jgi:polyisoprenoid-binding protein YceI
MPEKIKWSIDPIHSEIAFKVRHMMIANVKGRFTIFDANIYTDGKDFQTADIDLWIDPNSINTGDENRDKHLKSSEFFDTENHKQIVFVSNTFRKTDKVDHYELWGELTIRSITKNVKLDVEFGGIQTDPWGKEKAGFTVTGTVNRKDWELVWNSPLESGGALLGDEIKISCEVELVNSSDSTETKAKKEELQSETSESELAEE